MGNIIDRKPLGTRFDKRDGFIKIYDRTKYLTLLGPEKDMVLFTIELYILYA